MLAADGLCVSYGGIKAVKDVSFSVKRGEIVSLIGANGAGKTTALKAVAGLKSADGGSVTFEGKELLKTEPYRIVGLGLALVPEGRQVFSTMSVEENLSLGGYSLKKEKAEIEKAFELFPRLKERRKQSAGTLSGGEQQMLAVGRALMSKPKMLLIDELSMGLSPLLTKKLFKTVVKLKDEGLTILLVEQNAKAALGISDRAYVFETGRIVLSGKGKDLLTNEQVKKSYLGA